MTRREQQIETALREFFLRHGFHIRQDGDVFAEGKATATGRINFNVTELALVVERAL